jgi:hypothetical protein
VSPAGTRGKNSLVTSLEWSDLSARTNPRGPGCVRSLVRGHSAAGGRRFSYHGSGVATALTPRPRRSSPTTRASVTTPSVSCRASPSQTSGLSSGMSGNGPFGVKFPNSIAVPRTAGFGASRSFQGAVTNDRIPTRNGPSQHDRAPEQTFTNATCAPVEEVDKAPTFGPRDEIVAGQSHRRPIAGEPGARYPPAGSISRSRGG